MRSKAQVRMFRHFHKAVVFEQEELRLLDGTYRADATERLHQFWLKLGLYMEFEMSPVGDVLIVKHIRCLEDIS